MVEKKYDEQLWDYTRICCKIISATYFPTTINDQDWKLVHHPLFRCAFSSRIGYGNKGLSTWGRGGEGGRQMLTIAGIWCDIRSDIQSDIRSNIWSNMGSDPIFDQTWDPIRHPIQHPNIYRNQKSDFRYLKSDFRFQKSNFRHGVLSVQFFYVSLLNFYCIYIKYLWMFWACFSRHFLTMH